MNFEAEGVAVEHSVPESSFVKIEVNDNSVAYDTDMPVQDLVFWLEAVKSMIMSNVIPPDDSKS